MTAVSCAHDIKNVHQTPRCTLRQEFASLPPSSCSMVTPTSLFSKTDSSASQGVNDVGNPRIRYNRGNRLFPLIGLVLTLLLGITFIGCGVCVYLYSASTKNEINGDYYYGHTAWTAKEEHVALFSSNATWHRPLLYLALSIVITACTEATGFVQGTTLKWALAREGRLEYNANIRLFQTAGSSWSVNGSIFNILSALSLILSYATTSAIWLSATGTSLYPDLPGGSLLVFYFPLIILGVALTVQALLGATAFLLTDVPTWSSNPVDIAAALLHHRLAHSVPQHPLQSKRGLDITDRDPTQPCLWMAHRGVRRIVWLVWALIPLALLWGGVILAECKAEYLEDVENAVYTDGQQAVEPFSTKVWLLWHVMSPARSVLWTILIIATVQSMLTMSLHCSELVVLLARDEATCRSEGSAGDAQRAGNPLRTALGSWQTFGLVAAKPVLHWMFGNAIDAGNGQGFFMDARWIFYFSAAMVPLAGFITFVATRRPRGSEPATYGRIQTLANLFDESASTSSRREKADEALGYVGISCKSLSPGDVESPPPSYKDPAKRWTAFNNFLRSARSSREKHIFHI